MEKVTGIGGLFFRSSDPQVLGTWYQTHLGVAMTPANYEQHSWRQEAGPTVFGPFRADNSAVGRGEKNWSINFRVRNLEAMIAQLRAAGIDVTIDSEAYPNGRFAWLKDPEGNPIEIWEPAGLDALPNPEGIIDAI